MKKVISMIILFCFFVTYVFPQIVPGTFYFSPEEQEMMLIRVNVWGNVVKPGSVLVPDGTDLIGAISFAGGPGDDSDTRSIMLIHADGSKVKCSIGKYHKEEDRRHNPILKPGDTIIIPNNFWYTFTRGVSFIYQVAVIFYTVFQIWDMADTFINP